MENKALLSYMISADIKDKANLKEMVNYSINNNSLSITENNRHFFNIANGYKTDKQFIEKERKRLREYIRFNDGILLISAPTSFGKSTILRNEILRSKLKSVIITPTIALANEYFLALVKNEAVSISMSPFIDADIYVLTPEKAVSLLNKNNSFGIIAFDEFYESFSNARTHIFKEVYNLATKITKKIILITPEETEFEFDGKKIAASNESFVTSSSLTTRKYKYFISSKNKTDVYISSELRGVKVLPYKRIASPFKINDAIKEFSEKKDKTLLVLATKARTLSLFSETFREMDLVDINPESILKDIIDYVKEVSPGIELLNGLERGVAYHNGSMDKFLRLMIESAFRLGEIKILFANTTLTKGVNINPNYMYIDGWTIIPYQKPTKTTKALQLIDAKNAIGRTGRSINDESMLGTIFVFASSLKVEKIKMIDKAKTGERKTLIEEKPLEVISPRNYTDVYTNIIRIYSPDEIRNGSFLVEDMNDETKQSIKNYFIKRNEQNALELGGNIFDFFFLKFKESNYVDKNGESFYEGSKKSSSHWVHSSLNNLGYSSAYKHIKKMENLFISGTGYRIHWKEGYHKFGQTNYDPDLLLGQIISKYENQYGFHFQQILRFITTQLKNIGFLSIELVEEYESGLAEEESIATKKRWPQPFVNYFISKNKTKKTEMMLEKIKSKILK